jgi:hypothetical protein
VGERMIMSSGMSLVGGEHDHEVGDWLVVKIG